MTFRILFRTRSLFWCTITQMNLFLFSTTTYWKTRNFSKSAVILWCNFATFIPEIIAGVRNMAPRTVNLTFFCTFGFWLFSPTFNLKCQKKWSQLFPKFHFVACLTVREQWKDATVQILRRFFRIWCSSSIWFCWTVHWVIVKGDISRKNI